MSHRLTEDDRDLLRGHYLQGTSVADAAEAIGCSPTSVRTAFNQCELAGLARGAAPRRALGNVRRAWPEPYEGPAWIGKELAGAKGVEVDEVWVIELEGQS